MSFRDLYRLCWQTNEDIYVELFRTEEFSCLLGLLVEKGMEFRAAFRAYVEEITKKLPFLKRYEMNSLYWILDSLKREVRSPKKEMREPRCSVPILICYALVNRQYMMDLQSDRSLIRNLLDRGWIYITSIGVIPITATVT